MADYVITFKVRGEPPVVMGMDSSEADARSLCRNLISTTDNGRATLCLLDADGMLYMIGRWDHSSMAALVPVPSANKTLRIPATSRPQPPVSPAENGGPVQGTQEVAPTFQEAESPAEDTHEAPETTTDDDSGETYTGYCVKCQESREFHGEVSETANGRRMAKGKCPVCGTKVNRLLKNVTQDEWTEPETPKKASGKRTDKKAGEPTPITGDN